MSILCRARLWNCLSATKPTDKPRDTLDTRPTHDASHAIEAATRRNRNQGTTPKEGIIWIQGSQRGAVGSVASRLVCPQSAGIDATCTDAATTPICADACSESRRVYTNVARTVSPSTTSFIQRCNHCGTGFGGSGVGSSSNGGIDERFDHPWKSSFSWFGSWLVWHVGASLHPKHSRRSSTRSRYLFCM